MNELSFIENRERCNARVPLCITRQHFWQLPNSSEMSKRQTILFMTNSELGQASIVLAVAIELLLNPSLDVHIASFPPLSSIVPDGITFHAIPGPSMKQVLADRGIDFLPRHPPGVRGAVQSYREALPAVLAPWEPEQYLAIYEHCKGLIQEVDPTVVVLDGLFAAGSDACSVLKARHVILSPLTFKDHAMQEQPWLAALWKFGVLSSGFTNPLPLSAVLINIYLIIRLIMVGYHANSVENVIKARHKRGIPGQLSTMFTEFRSDLTYLIPSTPNTDFQLHIPSNIIGCGPMIPAFDPLEKTHPDLASWLAAKPTLIVNMGSHVTYAADQFYQVSEALYDCLSCNPYIQILWKCPVEKDALIAPNYASRIKLLPWLPAQPIAFLTASNSILAYVHHGGSNSFHEALAAGVPQVVCPVWLDTYDFATRAEYLGVGVRGNVTAAPEVQSAELATALARVVSGCEEADGMRAQARRLAREVGGADRGRKVAAERILAVAGLGNVADKELELLVGQD
ncbi:uncharacterized protein BCR38DRAFT_157791 [Pseudomassariella vexata]|uniref:Erythromycin biosynthesis protein CIII-like C-terminal domain-containing protein n=1 Tax=Pseudomassariella vexata TaxID=1141098 RepID=A0A1Y2E7A6_9PEZI|nr:uncharacterized protein BCR38DRAFT_157791 [Pseudomassariella vexata]ORY67420.1 hypothetical protein BCR38DRAFT_157791 [Pseudomassariella vexata]